VFHGGAGWTDVILLDDAGQGPTAPGEDGWTLQSDESYTIDGDVLEFDSEASGTITLNDGTEMTFVGVERIEW